VEKHVEHILEKLGVENRNAAIRLALTKLGS
jgi:DNA-binding NarL/FixJ family response regulator